jgi:hypothetical protein
LTITSVNNSVDAFAAKVNGSGITQWVKATGGSTFDYGNAIYADATGDVYAGGGVGTEAFLSKYNASGNLVWSVNPYPSSPAFPSNSILRINPYSNSILVNDSRVGFKSISLANGAVITSDSLIGNAASDPGATIMDVDGAGSGIVFNVMGRCGAVDIGSTSLVSSNSCPFSGISRDIFIVRNSSEAPPPAFQAQRDIPDPIATFQEVAVDEIEVYPNPANDELHITFPERDKETTLFIQNQFGRTVWSQQIESQRRGATINLNGREFQNGIYFIICLSDDKVDTKQFIIEK